MRLLLATTFLLLSACVTQTTYKASNKPVPDRKIDHIEIAKTRISLGLAYLQKQQMSDAKFNFEKALKYAPQLAEAHFSVAYYYQVVGDFENAESAYRRALRFEPDNADALNNYGVFLCERENYSAAQPLFLQALQQPSYTRAAQTYENLGLCSPKIDQQSLSYLEKALNHDPTLSRSLIVLVEHHLTEKEFDQAQRYIDRLMKLTPLTADAIWLAYRHADLSGRSEVAETWLQQMLSRFPDSQRSKAFLGIQSND